MPAMARVGPQGRLMDNLGSNLSSNVPSICHGGVCAPANSPATLAHQTPRIITAHASGISLTKWLWPTALSSILGAVF